MANGDYLGADVGVLEGGSNIAQNLGGSVLGAGMTLGATPAGVPLMIAGGALSILGTIGNIIAGDKRADIAEGSAYERSLTHTGALNRRYAQGGLGKIMQAEPLNYLKKQRSMQKVRTCRHMILSILLRRCRSMEQVPASLH